MHYLQPKVIKIEDAFVAIGSTDLSKPDGVYLESLGPPATYSTICAYQSDE